MSDNTRKDDTLDIQAWESEMSSMWRNVRRVLATLTHSTRRGECHL
jgi:hypothetical protein